MDAAKQLTASEWTAVVMIPRLLDGLCDPRGGKQLGEYPVALCKFTWSLGKESGNYRLLHITVFLRPQLS